MAWELSFIATGDAFYPNRTGIPFMRAINPGEIATSGRFRGQPEPSGWACIGPPDGLQGRQSLKALCNFVAQAIPQLRAAGAVEFTLEVVRSFENQCNEELSYEELALITSLNCTFCYSAYQS